MKDNYLDKGSQNDIDFIHILSGKNRSALIIAEKKHRGQMRDEDVPYILHTFAVAQTLAAAGANRNLICAGVLHDILEDTDYTKEELIQEFGDNVYRLVKAVTKTSEFKSMPLSQQAQAVLKKCLEAGPDGVALKSADLLANLTESVLDAEINGPAHWENTFGKKAPVKLNHYIELAYLLLDNADDKYPLLYKSLLKRVRELEALKVKYNF